MAKSNMPVDLYAIRKDGKEARKTPGYVRSDNVLVMTVNGKEIPLVLGGECKRLGIDPNSVSLIAGPIECLGKLGSNPGGIEVMTSVESARIDIAAKAERLEAAIPGVGEILNLAESVALAAAKYESTLKAQIERGTVMTAVAPAPADAERLASLLAANPRAAAYLDAKRMLDNATVADTRGHSRAAREAMEILMDGGSAEDAREELDDVG